MLWLVQVTINVREMLFAPPEHVLVLNPILDRIAKIRAIRRLVFQMHSVLFKIVFRCVDVCLDFNFCQFKELALILMNVSLRHPHVSKGPFAKTPLVRSVVSVPPDYLEIRLEDVPVLLLKNAVQMPNVVPVKLASLPKGNVSVEGVFFFSFLHLT